MENNTVVTGSRLHDAIILAAKAHKGQLRKGTNIDYLVHPMEVLEILSSMNADIDLKIAGVLHDTVEDTDLTLTKIQEIFGDDVANLVGKHTENKDLTWDERKRNAIETLRSADQRYQMLILADALSNLRSMSADYRSSGEQLWERFRAPKEKQRWYYGSMKNAMTSLGRQADCQARYDELIHIYENLFHS